MSLREQFDQWVKDRRPDKYPAEWEAFQAGHAAGLEDESRLSLEWNGHLQDILGRPNFTCSNIAEALRHGGADIPRKSEEEQAHVIHWLLCHYAKHGDKWIEKANESLAAIRAMKGEVK